MSRWLLILLPLVATGTPRTGRIYGGQNATSGQFPFIAALNYPDQFCHGSIIDQSWILTAAHCLSPLLIDHTTILVGTHTEHNNGTEYEILKAVPHENFNETTGQNDIGLIQIDGVLEYSDTIQPIGFGDFEVNANCVAAGWGETGIVDFPEVLQFVELSVIDANQCRSLADEQLDGYYLGAEQVCALAPEGRGACFGDSGGPLVCDGKLVGLFSYGVLPCAKGYPDIFIRPLAYADWIKDNIQ